MITLNREKLKLYVVLLGIILIGPPSFSQTYSIEYSLEKGDVFNTRLISEVHISQTVMGIEQNISMNMETDFFHEVTAINENNTYTLNSEYRRMALKITSSFFSIEIDTDKPSQNDILKQVMQNALNIPFQIQMTNKGYILDITGLDAIMKGLYEGSNSDLMQQEQISQLLSKNLGKENLQQSLIHFLSPYPDHPVHINETWKLGYKTSLEEIVLEFNGFGKLVEVSPKYFLIRIQGNLSTLSAELNDENGQVINLQGTQLTEIMVDRKTGWPIKSNANQDIAGNIQVKNPDDGSEAIEIPMQMKLRMNVVNR
jgi:hypothetical protein